MPAAMTGIPPEDLEAVWPHVAGLLADVCTRSRGKESLVELRAALGAGAKQLWSWWTPAGTVQALAVTEIVPYPGVRICRVCVATGERREEWLLNGLTAIEAWALEQGCERIEPVCRLGWERELKALGYRAHHTIMSKELS